jgi:hypothetical protein
VIVFFVASRQTAKEQRPILHLAALLKSRFAAQAGLTALGEPQ